MRIMHKICNTCNIKCLDTTINTSIGVSLLSHAATKFPWAIRNMQSNLTKHSSRKKDIATIHSMQRSQHYKGPQGIHYSCSKCDRVLPKLKWPLFRVARCSNPSSPWWLASERGVMLPDGFEVMVIHKKDKACKSEPPHLYWRASPYSVLQLTHRWEPRCLVITPQA